MVSVPSSSGGFVNVEILGVSQMIQDVIKYNKDILDNSYAAVLQSANFIQQEVQESIIGNRGEPKSVDTGRFANSISVTIEGQDKASVYTDVEYAKYLEYGTIFILPRSHFQNTAFRSVDQVTQIFKDAVKNV